MNEDGTNLDINTLFPESYDLIIDSLFGFSFKGPVKTPYSLILDILKLYQSKVFSVDIPSGWDVELGNNSDLFTP